MIIMSYLQITNKHLNSSCHTIQYVKYYQGDTLGSEGRAIAGMTFRGLERLCAAIAQEPLGLGSILPPT